MTPVERAIIAAFCAVPAFIRVEPASSSAPVSSRMAISATFADRTAWIVEHADGQCPHGAGVLQPGDT